MINFAKLVESVLVPKAVDRLLKFFEGNKSQLQKAYEEALENTVHWYEKKYGDKYGARNERFFDYRITENELAKLLLLRPEPDLELISQITLEEGKMAPQEIVREFATRLREEMGQIRECEELLVERDKFQSLKKIESHTAKMASDIHEIKEAVVGAKEDSETAAQPLDWQKLENAFNRRQLDKVPIKHVGGGLAGPETLELSEVFFEQDAGLRTYEIGSLDRKKIKSTEELQFLLKQADFWQAHIWRISQEHRDIFTGQRRFDKEEKEEFFEQVIDAITQALQRENRQLDAVQFQDTIDKAAKKLKKKPGDILSALQWLFETTVKREPVLTHLQAPCSALLIGDAGVGKTTVMRMLTLNLFEQLKTGKEEKAPIPIFVRLDKIADYMKEEQPLDQAQQALLTYICWHWKPDLSCEDDLTVPAIKNCQQPLQIILDGLDEIPSAKLRLKLAAVVKETVNEPLFDFIITSRPTAVNEALIRAFELPQVRLLELTMEQTKKFAHKFLIIYNGKNRKTGAADAQAFLSALEVSEAAQEFAGNPLYLTVMILMHKKFEVLPKKRIDLYAEFYEMLLLQRSSGSAVGRMADKPVFKVPIQESEPIVWWEDVYTPLLQRIAFITHSNEQDSVSISPPRIIEAIEQQGLQNEIRGKSVKNLAELFLDFADEHLGVLISRGPFYGFSHRSLQEYLTAKHLADFDESRQVKDFWADRALKKPDRWLEVARLLFCEIRTKPFLFKYLEGQWSRDIADTNDPRVIAMIGAVLFDLQEFFQRGGGIRAVHQNVAKTLASRRDKSHDTPQLFLACSDALGLMDESQIDVADPPMVYFEPKEPFNMGSDEYKNERPIHPVQLSPYWLGKYPVTNKEFAEFIKNVGYENEKYWYDKDERFGFDDGREFLKKELEEKAPRYWLDERFGKSRPLVPVVGVSWYEAMAYCRWWTLTFGEQWTEQQELERKIRMRLPTEAEWEFAARGFKGQKYPWGNTPEPTSERVNYMDSNLGQTSTVGSYLKSATPEGIFDLVGNVSEWCQDWYEENYYKKSPDKNPTGPEKGELRVLRGGAWLNGATWLRSSNRGRVNPWIRNDDIGFRCARAYV